MADGELAGPSFEELLELVRRQQAALAAREAAIERRDEKIRELEEELAQFRRPVKTPESSSVPPSRGQKATRVERRRRKLGPKCGHVGVSRVRSEPDVVVACRRLLIENATDRLMVVSRMVPFAWRRTPPPIAA